MECDPRIKINEADEIETVFPPSIQFQFVQLNPTCQLMNDTAIDNQVDELIKNIEKLRRDAKKKLKLAQSKHNKLISAIR
jgi:hypothetical protein